MGETGVIEEVRAVEAVAGGDFLLDQAAIEARAQELIDSRNEQPEVPVYRAEYRDNARTALMEAMTLSGHLSVVEITGSLDEINQQVMSRLLNGWNDNLPEHEKKRRFAEICEELVVQETHQAIVCGILPADTEVAVVSDIPVVVMKGIGYRYSNGKGMARSTGLRFNADGTFTRVIEQVSRSNSGPDTTLRFLEDQAVPYDPHEAPDVAALKAPFLHTRRDFIDGVVSIQRTLDRYAGDNVLYGDLPEASQRHVGYDQLRQESARREKDIEGYVDRLAELEEQLKTKVSEGELSPSESSAIFEGEIERILDAVCLLHPEYTEATYGKAAVAVFNEAALMVQRGDHVQAAHYLEAHSFMKQTIVFCGMEIAIKDAKELGLKVNELGELLEKGEADIKWKKGICRVEACPTRPGKTEVGPCSVCKQCQAAFDHGDDPTKVSLIEMMLKVRDTESSDKDKEDSTIKAA